MQAPDALRPGGVAHEEVFHLLLADEGEAAFQRFEGIAFGRLAVAAPVRDAGQQGRGGILRHVELFGRAPCDGPGLPQQLVGLGQVADDVCIDLAHGSPPNGVDRKVLDIGNRLFIATPDVRSEEPQQVEMHEGPDGQRLAADAGQNRVVPPCGIVEHAVHRGDDVVAPRTRTAIDFRTHVLVAVFEVVRAD